MEPKRETLAITVDKSHLITIGEKLYTQSIELIRELVNNAYDADSSVVEVEITEDRIVIKDNGSGMDLKGLKQYFNIGSPEKKHHPKSPKFKRDRIGQFGIGKFATLSACGSFTVCTQSRDFAAEVVFDKEEWGESEDNWHLPMTTLPYEASRGDGTTISLSKLTKKFNIEDVEERLIEGVPIRDKDFTVYLNGKRVMSRELPGRRFPVIEGTPFGPIHGEIVILPSAKTTASEPLGIECKVKQVTVKREYFGMDTWGRDMARVRGLIYADFLPVTTDRSGFIVDSEEYKAFNAAMLKVMEDVKSYLKKASDEKDTKGARRALREALHRVQESLRLNPDYAPEGMLPVGEGTDGMGGAGLVSEGDKKKKVETVGEKKAEKKKKEKKNTTKNPAVSKLTPDAVIQRLKMGYSGITCCIDHFGEEGQECFTEGNTIFINRDHPLYQREVKNRDTHILNISRLLTQEISLMKDPKNPRQAFERQSKLLRDAFRT